MHLADRIGFNIAQRQLRHSINADGTFKKKRINKFLHREEAQDGSGLIGFGLGFFLSIFGILIAYLLTDGNRKNRIKWAWIGAAVGAVLTLLMFILILSAFAG